MGSGTLVKGLSRKPPKVGRVDTEVLDKTGYEKELKRLQVELVRLQEWVVQEGLKVVVVFEGRDTAGKGGVIRRIAEKTNPRVVRTIARQAERSRAHAVVLPALRRAPAGGG